MKPINTSYYDFEKLVTGGFVYVDKTAQIYELAKPTADGRRVVYVGVNYDPANRTVDDVRTEEVAAGR